MIGEPMSLEEIRALLAQVHECERCYTEHDTGAYVACSVCEELLEWADAVENLLGMVERQAGQLAEARGHVNAMWARRYDTPSDALPEVTQGEPFPGPVVVDLGPLAAAQAALLPRETS